MRDFVTAVESPLHPGYVSLNLLGSVLMIGSLTTDFWEHKIESISEAIEDIHLDITYSKTIEVLQSYYSRHSKDNPEASLSHSSLPDKLSIMTTISPPQNKEDNKTTTCKTCKQEFPTTLDQNGVPYVFCKDCCGSYKKTNDEPSAEDIKKAMDLLARVEDKKKSKSTDGRMLLTEVRLSSSFR
jgi:hypothetical protein